jgi:glycosyltransferase involved in cell wall biosynthesis
VSRPVRLGLLAASPMYYQAPLYRRLAADARVDFTAIFASSSGARPGDGGFGRPVEFGLDVLEGYRSIFLRRADRTEIERGAFLARRNFDVVPAVLQGNFDVLWLHGYYSLTHVLAAGTQRLLRRPLLLREEQTLLHPRPFWKRAPKRVLLRAMFGPAHAVAIGRENEAWLHAHGFPAERIVHAPYCVDNDRLRDAAARLAPARDRLRRTFGLPADGPVIVSVARLVPKKQPELLLEAFRRVRASQQCALLVVGSGELEAALRRRVAEERIPDVVFAGFLDQHRIVDAYACADVFALASGWDETWGLVVNEAMNFGLPVVVTDAVGCASDLVRDGRTGLVVPAGSPDALAAALSSLARDPELRARLGAAGRERVRAWSCDVAAEGILEAVARTVGPRRWTEASSTGATRLRVAEAAR